MTTPIVVDIDGTMSRPDRSISGRIIDALHHWNGPIVIATGKAFPYPIALSGFIGIEPLVIAENGGVIATTNAVQSTRDTDALSAFRDDYQQAGYDFGWEPTDYANRWRETEIAINRSNALDPIEDYASQHGLVVIDSGYAYHVHPTGSDKGTALELLAEELGHSPSDFVAIGDSENDVPLFRVVTDSYAVANAHPVAKDAATTITTKRYGAGLLEALASIDS